MTTRSGDFVSDYIEMIEGNLPSEAVQPNGVDLSVDKIYRIEGTPRLTNDDYSKGKRVEVETGEDDKGEYYALSQDESYVVVYGEKIEIPQNHIGLVLPRSRMMRCGVDVQTAVWDSGYEGRGEGGIDTSTDVNINTDMRIAQMIYLSTESLDEHYDGSHQSERL